MDVVCLGILVSDIFAEPVPMLPQPGELKTTEGFLLSPGGCAANVAINLRRLNRRVGVVGKVGKDHFGDFVIAELRQHGIETEYIRRSASNPTSTTVILNVHGEDRRYLHCLGANRDFCLADLDAGVLEQARILYVGGYMAMSGFKAAELADLFCEAKSRGLITVLDVVIPAGVQDPAKQVIPALAYVDYFLPNDDEAHLLTGISQPLEQARALSCYNAQGTVIITLGSRGSLALRGKRVIETPPFTMHSVDESGAGDAFAAGLIVGLLEGWPLDASLQFAAAVGASCTRALGCSAGVFRFDEAVAYVKAHAVGSSGGSRRASENST
jgi:sugar/nucleoside kinase (ribokinase family)